MAVNWLQKLVLTTCILVTILPPTSSKRYPWMHWNDFKGKCDFKGYTAGGGVVELTKIKAPMAVLQKTALQKVLSLHGGTAAKAFGVAKSLSKIVPKLASSLGIFGVAMGMIGEFKKPTAAQILEATNKAISKLTEEVNDRLDEMKEYVDQEFINFEKDLMKNEYTELNTKWAHCVTSRTVEAANQCMEDVYRDIQAAQIKFTPSLSKVGTTTKLTNEDIKKIEAGLVSFRDYGQLTLMALQTLVDTFNDTDGPDAATAVQIYQEALNTKVDLFTKYAQYAYDALFDAHLGKELNGYCRTTYKCDGNHVINEGWWNGKHTSDGTTCSCLIDGLDTDKCKLYIKVRKDGKQPSSYNPVHQFDKNDYVNMQNQAYSVIAENAKTARSAQKAVIEKYWKIELLDFIPVWKSMKKAVDKEGRRRREIRRPILARFIRYDTYILSRNAIPYSSRQQFEVMPFEEQDGFAQQRSNTKWQDSAKPVVPSERYLRKQDQYPGQRGDWEESVSEMY